MYTRSDIIMGLVGLLIILGAVWLRAWPAVLLGILMLSIAVVPTQD